MVRGTIAESAPAVRHRLARRPAGSNPRTGLAHRARRPARFPAQYVGARVPALRGTSSGSSQYQMSYRPAACTRHWRAHDSTRDHGRSLSEAFARYSPLKSRPVTLSLGWVSLTKLRNRPVPQAMSRRRQRRTFRERRKRVIGGRAWRRMASAPPEKSTST